MNIENRLFRFIVGIDQALNPLVYGGSENITLSAQTAYNELVLHRDRRKRKVIDWIFLHLFDQKQHCYNSLVEEIYEFSDAAIIRVIMAERGLQ